MKSKRLSLNSMDDQQYLQRTINEKVNSYVPEQAWDSTVALVIMHENAVHQFGSGILFSIADDSFVVTAGHVVKQAQQYGKTLGISSATGFFVAVSGEWICSSEGQYGTDKDPFDIAIHRLSQDEVAKIGHKTFLRFDDIDFDSQSQTAVYTLFGFPCIWSKPSSSESDELKLKPLQYTAFAYDRMTEALEEYQERFHILLSAQQRDCSNLDGSPAQFQDLNGNDAPFPEKLSGISGCSVWRIGDLNVPIKNWDQEQSRIVAVQTGVYNSAQVIKATRWVAVSTLLHVAFPELRPAMQLWRM
jgi:hypothetical protein